MYTQTRFKKTEIGETPEDWSVFPLSQIVNIISGGTPKTSESKYWNGDIPWLSITDFNSGNRFVYETEKTITEDGLRNSSTQLLKKGQVVISARGTVGAISQVGKDMTFNQSCYGLDAKELLSNDFLYYLLKYQINSIKQKTHGSVFSTITRETFDHIIVAMPLLKHGQDDIVNILSSLDNKIELNRKINKTLEEIGQALFKRWFVDFEFPNSDGKPYKSNGGEMVDSELGEIPEGWKVSKIKDLIDILSGFAFSSSDFSADGTYKLITIKNVQDRYFDQEIKDRLVEFPAKMPDYCKLDSGDILLSLTGNVGRACFVNGENFLLNQRVAKLKAINSIDYAFTYLLFLQDSIFSLLQSTATGTAQQNLSPIQTKEIEIIISDRKTLDQFGKATNRLIQKINDNSSQIQTLSMLRDSLLPRLMSGRLRVN